MPRHSTITQLPANLRAELDQWIKAHVIYENCASMLLEHGFKISKSAIGRYAKKLIDGRRELEQLSIGSQTLAEAAIDAIKNGEPRILARVLSLLELQLRSVAELRGMRHDLLEMLREQRAQARGQDLARRHGQKNEGDR